MRQKKIMSGDVFSDTKLVLSHTSGTAISWKM